MRNRYHWETIFHAYLTFAHVLQAEALRASVLDYLFKNVCEANRFGREKQYPSLEQRGSLFTVQYSKNNDCSMQRSGCFS